MNKVKKNKRRLEDERMRIMDLMVREHVQSMEHQIESCEHIDSKHRLELLEQRYKQISIQLQELEKCKDVLRNLKIQEKSDPQTVRDFYSQLESLVTSHCDSFNESAVSIPITYTNDSKDSVKFSAEEEYGKYLDLHECHQHYMTLKHVGEIDYNSYVAKFDHLFDFPQESKNDQYCQYVKALFNYLHGYLARVQPLYNINDAIEKAGIKFETQWRSSTFPGWLRDSENGSQGDKDTNSEFLVLSSLSKLKSSLAELKLESDEPVETNVQRVSSKKDEDKQFTIVEENKITGNCKVNKIEKYKEVATLEAIVYCLLDLVSIQRVATLEKVQRR